MKKQLRYKDEVRPSVSSLIIIGVLIIACIALLTTIIFDIINFNDVANKEINYVSEQSDIARIKVMRKDIIESVAYTVGGIVSAFLWIKSYKKYKIALEDSKVYKKYGKKYKGIIKKTEIATHTETNYHTNRDITIYEYYALIEFTDDNGEKMTFKTPQLNGNPEYLNTKEVSVYSFDGVNYATDFGYIKKPKGDIKDIMYDSTST